MTTQRNTTTLAGGSPVERGVGRLFADAMDADRLARGEAPKAPLTEARVFDDDIEVMRFACHKCGSQRWRWLCTRFLGESDGVDVEVDEHECADCKARATW